MANNDAISAISNAANTLFKEVGETVRQLGGKRQKALYIASEMQMQRAERLKQQSMPEKQESVFPWLLGTIAFIIVVALVIKKV